MAKLAHKLLTNPIIYTYLRRFVAGSQLTTKKFILDNINFNNCHSVLDLCCGTGDFAIFSKDIEYLGIDKNNSFINYAKKRYKKFENIHFRQENILTFVPQKAYDAVLLISAIHHFSDDEIKKTIKVIKKCMRKILIVVDLIPNPPNFLAKSLVKLDVGNSMREPLQKMSLFEKDFEIYKQKYLSSFLAFQFGFVAKVKKNGTD